MATAEIEQPEEYTVVMKISRREARSLFALLLNVDADHQREWTGDDQDVIESLAEVYDALHVALSVRNDADTQSDETRSVAKMILA